jgi:hypothetical protein
MMQQHNGHFIDGAAKMIQPFSPDWRVGGSVLRPGRLGSIVEVTRFEQPSFTVCTLDHTSRNLAVGSSGGLVGLRDRGWGRQKADSVKPRC